MPKVTVSEAVELIEPSKSTLYRHMENGTVSYTTDARGQKVINISELQRIYGTLKKPSLNGDHSHENGKQEDLKQVENTDLAPDNTAVIEVLREQIEMLKPQLENANRGKAKVFEILEKQTLMLLPPPKKKKSWWGYFRLRR